jgi:hypothetical protein
VLELAQVVPHVPQLLLSEARFVHVPEQLVYGDAHTQAPAAQVRLPPQLSLQKPQLPLLV